MVGTHARRRSAYSAAKTGVRKVANGEQRRESVGSPTWLTNGQSALHHRWISSWFPARYTAFAFTHERDGREKEREREKEKSRRVHARAKCELQIRERRRERKANDGRRKKEEERRVCIASRLPLYPGRQRGEGEGQKEGHNMPNERAPWTSRCGLSSQREESLEGRCVARRKRESEKERGGGGNSLDTPRVDVRERDGLGERARPLNLEQSGRAISARTRRPVSIVVGFCDRAADGQPPEARQIRATAPRLSRRRDRRRKE